MRAVVWSPGRREPRLAELPEPSPAPGQALVRTLWTGIDGTDEEVVAGEGRLPPGEGELVLGHEALGEVVAAPAGSGLAPGDLVVPLVRRGCDRCLACAHGAPDHCETDAYVERGIKQAHGFMQDLFVEAPERLVRAPPELGRAAVLAEPLSIVEKALDQARRVQARLPWFAGSFEGARVLVVGIGSLGGLAAMRMALEGAKVVGADRSGPEEPGGRLLARVGAAHVDVRETSLGEAARAGGGFDVAFETTGNPDVTVQTAAALAANGLLVQLGLPSPQAHARLPAAVLRDLVLGNRAIMGSVNSRREHFERALAALSMMRARWGDLPRAAITRTFAPWQAEEAFGEERVVKKALAWGAMD
ncbi:MAG TPA: alcohol dehydrogenase catalytic domain-containing protein [Candidatus Thermoplasmatota archaeon]|nr:alcohol dehydrogenase catalytic domain-containing protein [Candidatus Thermoplasmatota archaeon]